MWFRVGLGGICAVGVGLQDPNILGYDSNFEQNVLCKC